MFSKWCHSPPTKCRFLSFGLANAHINLVHFSTCSFWVCVGSESRTTREPQRMWDSCRPGKRRTDAFRLHRPASSPEPHHAQGEDQDTEPLLGPRCRLATGRASPLPLPTPRAPTLTLDFLYPHFPGDEGDHEVTGPASKFPPELERREQG